MRHRDLRAAMDEALKRIVVPRLREMGFRGSRPHLRRQRGETWDLLTFQFSMYGPSFVVEMARFPLQGIADEDGLIPPEKVQNRHISYRNRLGSPGFGSGDGIWFDFEQNAPDEVAFDVLTRLADPRVWEIVDSLPPGGDRRAMEVFEATWRNEDGAGDEA